MISLIFMIRLLAAGLSSSSYFVLGVHLLSYVSGRRGNYIEKISEKKPFIPKLDLCSAYKHVKIWPDAHKRS